MGPHPVGQMHLQVQPVQYVTHSSCNVLSAAFFLKPAMDNMISNSCLESLSFYASVGWFLIVIAGVTNNLNNGIVPCRGPC